MQDCLDELCVIQNHLVHLLAKAPPGSPTEGELLKHQAQIKKLIEGELKTFFNRWNGDTTILIGDLSKGNQELEDCVQRIQSQVKVADGFIRALSVLDRVLGKLV